MKVGAKNYRNGQQRYFWATFISDTHPERTEAIVKSTHQTYKFFNFYLVPHCIQKN
jgi:hypothetical protein